MYSDFAHSMGSLILALTDLGDDVRCMPVTWCLSAALGDCLCGVSTTLLFVKLHSALRRRTDGSRPPGQSYAHQMFAAFQGLRLS